MNNQKCAPSVRSLLPPSQRFIYIYIYIYIHTYIHTYILAYTHTRTHSYTQHVCVCVCVFVVLSLWQPWKRFIYIYTHAHTSLYIYTHAHTSLYIYTHAHTSCRPQPMCKHARHMKRREKSSGAHRMLEIFHRVCVCLPDR